MTHYTFSEIQNALQAKSITLPQLVQSYLKNIETKRDLNIFLDVFGEEAQKKAEEVQAKIDAGNAGKLAGMVIALKDNICYAEHKVSASSKMLEGFESLFSATVVERLLAEDAVIIGATNCDEFAMGSSNENSAFGVVKNPLNPSLVPGGSSGGSAACVAAEMCTASLGSDTGGSIRQPASFCGVVGLKPTYGRVSRHGLIAFASSFDQIGPFTRDVKDAALLLEVIAGKDNFDSTASTKPVGEYSQFAEVSGNKKIALLKDAFGDGNDPAVKNTFEKIESFLKKQGHEVAHVEVPNLKNLVPTYYVLTTAEASSNLSRYSGIHYGKRAEGAAGIDDTYLKSRTEGFGPEVKRRIMLGTFVLSAGYYDSYYGKAQKIRRLIKDSTEKLLTDFDALILPTTPTGAFPIGAKSDDPITMYLEDLYTVQANLAGVPAISIPLSNTSEGLPLGVQVMTKSFDEAGLFNLSNYLMNNLS